MVLKNIIFILESLIRKFLFKTDNFYLLGLAARERPLGLIFGTDQMDY